MKLSTRIRYGTRLMIALGEHYGGKHIDLTDIAKSENISRKYLSQIVIPLKAADLIESYRGAKGGYSLAKDPYKISIYDLYSAIEGEINLVPCTREACPSLSACLTHPIWDDLGTLIADKLRSITIGTLVEQRREINKAAMMYNI